MSRPLQIEVSDLAKVQIVAAERWWRANRPAAPNAIREELERASSLISVQPGIGFRHGLPGICYAEALQFLAGSVGWSAATARRDE